MRPCLLLSLPTEVREVILHYAFGGISYVRLQSPSRRRLRPSRVAKHDPQGVLSTCHVLREEAIPIFYSQTTLIFHCSGDAREYLLDTRVDPFVKAYISHLAMDDGDSPCMESLLQTHMWLVGNAFKICPSLGALEFRVAADNRSIRVMETRATYERRMATVNLFCYNMMVQKDARTTTEPILGDAQDAAERRKARVGAVRSVVTCPDRGEVQYVKELEDTLRKARAAATDTTSRPYTGFRPSTNTSSQAHDEFAGAVAGGRAERLSQLQQKKTIAYEAGTRTSAEKRTTERLIAYPTTAPLPLPHRGFIPPVKMGSRNLYLAAFIACQTGALFGYCIGFVGGILVLPSFLHHFKLDTLPPRDIAAAQSQIVTSWLVGCVIGVPLSVPVCARFGRKACITFAAAVYVVGAVLQLLNIDGLVLFEIGRLLNGVGVGAGTLVSPVYVSEISPPAQRGALVSSYQVAIQVFALIGFWGAYASHQAFDGASDLQWQVPVMIQLIPGVLLLLGSRFILPESPRWLASQTRFEEVRVVLSWLRMSSEVEQEAVEMEKVAQRGLELQPQVAMWRRFYAIRKRLAVGMGIMIAQNALGLNAINYYAPIIFMSAGFKSVSSSLLLTGIFGLVKLVSALSFTFLFVRLRTNKFWLLLGSLTCAISMFVLALCIEKIDKVAAGDSPPKGFGITSVIMVYVFALAFGVSLGPISWNICAEIFPSFINTQACAVTTAVQWVGQIVIAAMTPFLIASIGWGTYVVFGVLSAITFFWCAFFVPETRGVPMGPAMDAVFGDEVEVVAEATEEVGEASEVAPLLGQITQRRGSPSYAVPHRILLIADPQLVDPHTYPGRGWLLNSLTFAYTDRYLRRANFQLHSRLQPDTTLFLGDLFDGGREWATATTTSPEGQYRQYGQDFWLREYRRFSDIFLRNAIRGPLVTAAAPMGRRIIASLPGNHDLGFGRGIQSAVRSRFDAFFGPLNRIDVLGNHSLVSLDTVSLSAIDQADPQTGSSGAGDGSAAASANSHLWQPAEDFLAQAKTLRQQAVRREAAHMQLIAPQSLAPAPLPARVFNLTDPVQPAKPPPVHPPPNVPSALFPTILLSHVPFFRAQDTPCGPLREGSPSIRIAGGYQYQNVLTPFVSADIIKHLSATEVVQIYSGDDHDYCEIEHSEFTGRIREITVKSISWAMGVRRPGVQLVSLWNPIDPAKLTRPAAAANTEDPPPTPRDTLQNHLCLFPDQLAIFIRYGQILALTVLILAVAAVRYNPAASTVAASSSPGKFDLPHPVTSRPRISSPYYGRGPPKTKFRYFIRSLWEVAVPALAFYVVLIWLG
ncbi:hypothetical protein DV738_g3396, partial [Chaetothyriales sp. CBS 135597]